MEVKNPNNLKVLAYYLPQFHPTPENDEWWGEGFTEWTNVTKAQPYFEGHGQPQFAGEVGYYDLRLPEVREKQAQLARDHGVYGFCYYYYWFAGRRILERPLQEVLDAGKPDFPFCICWANESWSRRWDGSENELLLEQIHDAENDRKFIEDVIPVFKDPRYIRVDGKPLLIVYRASLFPTPSETADMWREACIEAGLPGLHLVSASTFGAGNPHEFGFDAACEFPPHGLKGVTINSEIDDLDPEFTGKIYDYGDIMETAIRAPENPGYELYRGVMTSWDNTPRRGKAGNVFHGATPALYERWLRVTAAKTVAQLPEDRRFIFVNAWNEWAESAHLEPCRRWGRGYLEATRRVVSGQTDWRSEVALLRDLYPDVPVVEQAVASIERHFIGLEQANRHLAKLDSVMVGNRIGTIAVDTQPAAWAECVSQVSGRGNIDQINQFRSGEPVGLKRGDTLSLFGWMIAPGTPIGERTPIWIALRTKAMGKEWIAPVWQRNRRIDVADYLAEIPREETEWAGFRALIDTRMVPAGDYELWLAMVSAGNLVTVRVQHKVHIR